MSSQALEMRKIHVPNCPPCYALNLIITGALDSHPAHVQPVVIKASGQARAPKGPAARDDRPGWSSLFSDLYNEINTFVMQCK